MIVHPIGMMRANAASGLNFVDDFTTYTTGVLLGSQTPPAPYVVPSGANGAHIRDDSGTRVARLEGVGTTTYRYSGATLSADREVTMTSHGIPDASIIPFEMFLSHVDDNNYIKIFTDMAGWVTVQQKDGGTQTNYYQSNVTGVPTSGDVFKLILNGGSLTAWRNATQLGGTFSPTVTLGQPAFRLSCTSGVTVGASIRKFTVKDI